MKPDLASLLESCVAVVMKAEIVDARMNSAHSCSAILAARKLLAEVELLIAKEAIRS